MEAIMQKDIFQRDAAFCKIRSWNNHVAEHTFTNNPFIDTITIVRHTVIDLYEANFSVKKSMLFT